MDNKPFTHVTSKSDINQFLPTYFIYYFIIIIIMLWLSFLLLLFLGWSKGMAFGHRLSQQRLDEHVFANVLLGNCHFNEEETIWVVDATRWMTTALPRISWPCVSHTTTLVRLWRCGTSLGHTMLSIFLSIRSGVVCIPQYRPWS